MSDIGLEILIVGLLILANGIFALSEMAVVTARKSRLEDWARKGNRRAATALDLARNPSDFLSAVQVGITLIGILAGAFGGRTIAGHLNQYFSTIVVVQPYSEAIALSIVVLTITFFTLVIGELAPKRLAMRHPEMLAAIVAFPLRFFSKLAAPIVYLLSLSTDAVCRLFGKQTSEEPPVTEEEIKTLVQKGTEAGVFEESEQDMVEAVFRLGDKSARSLMTPRTQICWLDLADSIEDIRKKIIEEGHSRFPVADGSLDNVVGIVQAKSLLTASLAGKPIHLKSMIQEPLFVPRSLSALELLESFKTSNKHLGLVVDEYGGIEGLLTHHDILEAIAGDIPFGEAPADPKAVRREDGSWLLDGMLTVDEFKEIFNLDILPGEKRDAYQTLGGFIFTQMGRVPMISESFQWDGIRFEIVDMDGKRIDKVLVTVLVDDIEASAYHPDSETVE